jgi:hypothetical protein
VLRERFESQLGCLAGVGNDVLGHVLTTTFFAGLETHEGERNPVRLVFVGSDAPDVVMPDESMPGAAPLYRWKMLRFAAPRPFAVRELVKLSVATLDERLYVAARLSDRGRLSIFGLAREGMNSGNDPFVKIVVPRPGGLSIRSGREHLLEYEHGTLVTGGEDVVFGGGQVRRALEATARAAGLDDDTAADYVRAVRSLVREMAAHGRGGILVVSSEENPEVGRHTTYRMVLDSALAPLLRISRLLARKETGSAHIERGASRPGNHGPSPETPAFRHLLWNSFMTESERIVQELGALTGIDGATVLNRNLALVAFGVILPVAQETRVVATADPEGTYVRAVDLGSRGTRHRAAATYAGAHPGSVVFVASEDGHVMCMLRRSKETPVVLWRLGAADVRTI